METPEQIAAIRNELKARVDQLNAESGELRATIAAMTQGHNALTEKAQGLGLELASAKQTEDKLQADIESLQVGAKATIAEMRAKHAEQIQSLGDAAAKATADRDARIAELSAALAAQTERAERLKVQATRNNAAIIAAAAQLNGAVSAQQIEQADKPE